MPDVAIVSKTVKRPNVHDVARGLVEGNPTIIALKERGTVNPKQVVGAVADRLAAQYGERDLHIPLREIFFSAQKPRSQND